MLVKGANGRKQIPPIHPGEILNELQHIPPGQITIYSTRADYYSAHADYYSAVRNNSPPG